MFSPRLTDCVDCTTIPVLLKDIDRKLADLAKTEYNNIVFILNKSVNRELVFDLINYKRILTYKFCNQDYAKHFTIEMIASRIKLLKHK